MSFIYPSFLFALAAVGIPIIIHLFNLQRTKRVYFSNTAFLKTVQSLNKRSIKVKYIFILLSRILFITFLVLAFAQPYIPSEQGNNNNAELINIYIDNSLSNQVNIGNDRVLDVSVKNAEALGRVLPPNASIQIFNNDISGSAQTINKEKVTEVVSSIGFSSRTRTLNEVVNKKLRIPSESKVRETYVFSDFQKSFLKDVNTLNVDSSNLVKLFPVTPQSASNVYIDSVWLENPFIRINENTILNARVVNSGNEPKDNVLLKLSIEGRQASTVTVNAQANSSQKVSFNFSVTEHGFKTGSINIEDYPVTFDNDHYFSFQTADKVRILEISSIHNSVPSYIKKVYSNTDIFDIASQNVESMDHNSLSNYDLLVLNNLTVINAGLIQALTSALENNTSLLVVPSSKLELKSYSDFLRTFSIIVEKSTSDSVAQNQELEQIDLANPFFSGVFESQKERMVMPKEQPVLQWNRVGKNHLSFKNGAAFLTEVKQRGGKIYLLASDLLSSGGLAFNALFVPVMYKIAFNSKLSGTKLSYNFDDNIITLPIKLNAKEQVLKVDNGKLEFIPGQRILNNEVVLEIRESWLTPGHYNLKLKDSTVSVLSFNYPPNESRMEFYSIEELKDLLANKKNIEVFEGASRDKLIEEINETNQGLPLWKICILISLLFLFVEILLLRYYKVKEVVELSS